MFVVWLALTPALSPEEREEQADVSSYSGIKMSVSAFWFIEESSRGVRAL
jgi:hypothetical protein